VHPGSVIGTMGGVGAPAGRVHVHTQVRPPGAPAHGAGATIDPRDFAAGLPEPQLADAMPDPGRVQQDRSLPQTALPGGNPPARAASPNILQSQTARSWPGAATFSRHADSRRGRANFNWRSQWPNTAGPSYSNPATTKPCQPAKFSGLA
jgi:hypothetical protein